MRSCSSLLEAEVSSVSQPPLLVSCSPESDALFQGLFARRRQLLLTEGPHLYYVDPVNKVLKGEIPWSPELRPEAKNFKTFFVHTVGAVCFLSPWRSHLRRYYYFLPFNKDVCFYFSDICSPTEHTIWWTPVETLTDGARRSRKCGEGFIRGTKTPAYRRVFYWLLLFGSDATHWAGEDPR